MRFLHTGDWHLGHLLRDHPRSEEHALFLEFLLGELQPRAIDALLITGDVFDTGQPGSEAQQQWFRFLSRARAARPALTTVVIAGNHDSAARLSAPAPVLAELGVHVVGAVDARNEVELKRAVVRLPRSEGKAGVTVLAVPFLRPGDLDLSCIEPGPAALAEGVRRLHAQLLALARLDAPQGERFVAMGHGHVRGGRNSEQSERRIVVGGSEQLPVDVFPAGLDYVALGHLHLAQEIRGAAMPIRYAGSPLPLSVDERGYPHQLLCVELGADGQATVESLRTPRPVEFLRLPAQGAAPLAALQPALAALAPLDASQPEWKRPFLELWVEVAGPTPGLRREVEQLLEGKAARLLALRTQLASSAASPVAPRTDFDLRSWSAEEVLVHAHQRKYGTAPDDALLSTFRELEASTAPGEGSAP